MVVNRSRDVPCRRRGRRIQTEFAENGGTDRRNRVQATGREPTPWLRDCCSTWVASIRCYAPVFNRAMAPETQCGDTIRNCLVFRIVSPHYVFDGARIPRFQIVCAIQNFHRVGTPMKVMIDICVTPMGVGLSVSPYVAECEKIFKAAGLSHNLHGYGTNVEGEWDDVMAVNLKSVFNLTKNVIRPMLKKRKGSIINITSVVGITGNAGQANYAASKAGIIGFTKSIAQELGSRNIRCNAIAPGFIETEMTAELGEDVMQEWLKSVPLNRPGSTEDVANAVLFLASDLSTYVSGQTLNVCGAMLT